MILFILRKLQRKLVDLYLYIKYYDYLTGDDMYECNERTLDIMECMLLPTKHRLEAVAVVPFTNNKVYQLKNQK